MAHQRPLTTVLPWSTANSNQAQQAASAAASSKDNSSINKNSILSDSFLGNVIELCIVTPDHKRTLQNLSKLGIGPWRIYTFDPSNTSNQTYHGKPSPFRLKVCFAELPGKHNERAGLVYEVIEPLPLSPDSDNDKDKEERKSGAGEIPNNIFAEFLHRNQTTTTGPVKRSVGEIGGIHHVAYDLNGRPFHEREAEFERRGFRMTQGGSWMGVNHFAFFEPRTPNNSNSNNDDDNNDPGTVFETIAFPDDWEYPEPEEWFPFRP